MDLQKTITGGTAAIAVGTASVVGGGAVVDKVNDGPTKREDAVVQADAVITSRGPGTAVAFALVCIERLCGFEKAREIQEQIVG